MDFDEEAYGEFSEIIIQSYESLLDFQSYRKEAEEVDDVEYRRDAVTRAFSAAQELNSVESGWDYLFETFPAEVGDIDDLMIKTEVVGDKLRIYDLDLEGEPDREELAAIRAVRDNYNILQEYDLLNFWREVDMEVGNINLKMSV